MKNRVNTRSRRRRTLLLTLVLITTGLLAPTALVHTNQQPPNRVPPKPPQQINTSTASSVRITRPPSRINPRLIRVNARPPIVFKPLDMVDPRTGKTVAANTMLKLDDGRQMPAGKFYEQMNKLEASFNKIGYSFRDQQKEVVTNEVVLDKAKTLGQIRNMRFSPPNPKTAAQLNEMAASHRSYVRSVNPYFGKIPPKGQAPKVSKGLFTQKISALMDNRINTSTATGIQSNLPKKRPDFVPGAGAVSGLGSDTETLPQINLDPGPAQAGKRSSAIQVNAGWNNVAFYVNYLNAATGPLAPRYLWQVAKASPSSFDNFGSFQKAWNKEFDNQELVNWSKPAGLISSGNASFLQQGSTASKRERLFLIDFSKFAGNPPPKPVFYLVRIVPVNPDGSIAGYPSRPVLVVYSAEPPLKVELPKPAPVPSAKFPGTNIARDGPNSFGDPSVMSLDLNTWMKSSGSLTQETASVGFDAGCSVLGQSFSLLKINAVGDISAKQLDGDGKVTFQGKAQGKISYFVLGFELPCDNCEQTSTSSVTLDTDYTKEIDEGFTFGFPIGPIDVSGTVGFRGSVGFGGHVGLSTIGGLGNSVVLSAGPHVSAHVYLEAGAGIGVAGFDVLAIGVGGEVNLISAGFLVGLSIDGSGAGKYFGRISELKVLNGRLYGFAKAGICPLCKKWEVTIFDWAGYDLLVTDPGHATLFEGAL